MTDIFKHGRIISVFNEKHPGGPTEVAMEDMVNKIRDIVLTDRCGEDQKKWLAL